jgi:hypothetical protein
VEKSSQIGQKLPRVPLGRESSSWREEEEEYGGGSSRGEEEEEKIAIANVYRATTRACTNVLIFVPSGGSDWYKCTSLTFVRLEPPPGTNVWHLYRVGGRWSGRGPVRGHLYRFVPSTGTNVVICTWA